MMNKKRIVLIGLAVLAAGGLPVFAGRIFLRRQSGLSRSALPTASVKLASVKEVNREFSFNLKNKEKTKIKYLIESAETVSEITVKGEKVKTLPGKSFLILNLKITNEGKQGIQMNCRDFVRLSLADREEWLAPDIHNDPVEVQAISTRYTRLGFPVPSGERKFTVKMGEIEGEKTSFGLEL